jgi:D-glycero-alpha-D-manno-heptose-7-phosphate kinase
MITSSAPTRIDLAGGTLDIWPLYLLLNSPPTLNAAINLYATVNLKTRKDKAVLIESQDLGLKQRFSSIKAFPDKHPLELIMRIIKFYNPDSGIEVTTNCQAPAGSGIGGSSALNIALNGGFNRLTGNRFSKSQLIEIAKNIETQVIRVPAGLQDYYPAMYGGVQSIRPGLLNVEPENIQVDMTMLNNRFILCYTGKPRQSGINNWQVLKLAVDGDKKTLQKLNRIQIATEKIDKVLRKDKLPGFASLFNEEWQARKFLAPGISTPHMDQLIGAAKLKGALAAKVCGAGGGGCVAFYIKEGTKEKISLELNRLGGSVLPFNFVKRGLRVSG